MSVFGVIVVRICPAFGLNTERYGVSLGIQSKCGKIRTRITPNTSTFYAVFEESLYLEEDGLHLLEERYYNDYNWNVDDEIKSLKTPQKDCGKHFFPCFEAMIERNMLFFVFFLCLRLFLLPQVKEQPNQCFGDFSSSWTVSRSSPP